MSNWHSLLDKTIPPQALVTISSAAQTCSFSNTPYCVDLSLMTSDELKETQTIMEEKVYRIWTVLSAFEGKDQVSSIAL